MTNGGTADDQLALVTNDVDEWLDIDLEPDNRATKGIKDFLVPQLSGWISLGKPIIRQLANPADPVLSDFDFYHVLFATSFRPEEGANFDRVWVQIQLNTNPEGEAIAWSMHPLKEYTQVDIKRTVGVNGKVGLEWASAEANAETEHAWVSQEPYLLALNEMRSDPVWEFITTEKLQILGSHRLHLVVRRKSSLNVDGVMTVTATVKHKHFGLFTCKSKVDQTPSMSFVID